MSHVNADAPPVLVVHGDLDNLAPVDEARAFVREAARGRASNPVVYVELPGAHHAFDVFHSIRTMETIAGVDRFLAWLLTVDPPARDLAAPTPPRRVPTERRLGRTIRRPRRVRSHDEPGRARAARAS